MTLSERIAQRAGPVEHDPAYCDAHRPRGWGCNQPHAAADPHGAQQPIVQSPFTRRALRGELPAKGLDR